MFRDIIPDARAAVTSTVNPFIQRFRYLAASDDNPKLWQAA
jgi:hypothetical protein